MEFKRKVISRFKSYRFAVAFARRRLSYYFKILFDEDDTFACSYLTAHTKFVQFVRSAMSADECGARCEGGGCSAVHSNEAIATALQEFFMWLLGSYRRFVRPVGDTREVTASNSIQHREEGQPLAAFGLVLDHEAFISSKMGSSRTRNFLKALRQTQVCACKTNQPYKPSSAPMQMIQPARCWMRWLQGAISGAPACCTVHGCCSLFHAVIQP